MAWKFNIFTGTFDISGSSSSLSNYMPKVNDASNAYFVQNGNTLELWWKTNLVQSWSIVSAPPTTGMPFVFGASLIPIA